MTIAPQTLLVRLHIVGIVMAWLRDLDLRVVALRRRAADDDVLSQ